jgi:hypothetical protein
MTHVRGKCLCGAVEFSVGLPTLWMAHCHCTQCQRAHGAGFVTWVGAASERFTCRDPDALLRWFASSSAAERGFCGRCGSSLFFRSSNWPGETHIARANFIDALDRQPSQHGYYDTHVDWLELNDALPKKPAP